MILEGILRGYSYVIFVIESKFEPFPIAEVDGSVGQSNTFSVTHAFSIEHSVSIVPDVPPSPPIPTNTHPMQTIYKFGIHNLKFTLPSS